MKCKYLGLAVCFILLTGCQNINSIPETLGDLAYRDKKR